MFNFQKFPFAKLSFYSPGEVEAHIHRELFDIGVVTYWPTALRSPLPLLESAMAAIPPGKSYGYINGSDRQSRVWLIREEDHYSIFVSYELSGEFTAALSLLSFGDVSVVSSGDGWTNLKLFHSGSLPLVVAALKIWAFALCVEQGCQREVEYQF